MWRLHYQAKGNSDGIPNKLIIVVISVKPLPLKHSTQLALLAIVFALSLNSCRKKDALTIPSAGGTILDREEYFDSTSGSVSTLHYLYNSAGDLISIVAGSPNGGDTLFYDTPGKLSRYKAGNAWEALMIYDTTGRIVGKRTLFYSPQQSSGQGVFTYDDRGRVIADSGYDDSGKLWSYNSFSYDNDDNLISYQRFWLGEDRTIYTGGLTTVTYDRHPNPHATFGKWLYYGIGAFQYLFKENSISEKSGSAEQKNPPDLVYTYYSDGQLWQASSAMNHTTITYYYK